MKEQWDNLSRAIGEMQINLNSFFEGITERKYSKGIKILNDLWNKIILLQNEFDKLVEPVKPVDVKLPFKSQEFAELWVFYKDYLIESHQTYLGSRQELMILRRLNKLADKNENSAIQMLEFFMSSGYKTVFKPTQKQITGEEPAKNEEKNITSFDMSVKAVDL